MHSDLLKPIQWLRRITDTVIVGVSGGKDSVAVLDLCAAANMTIHAYTLEIVPDLRLKNEYFAMLERRYGITIQRYPHPERVQCFREGRYCNPVPDLVQFNFRDVWEKARADFGVYWLATGEKKVDSLERRAQLSAWGAVQPARGRAFPLAEWKERDVYDYLQRRAVPLAPEYRYFGHSLATPLEGRVLAILKEHYPDDYEKVCRDFPFAEASLVRHDGRVARGERIHGRNAKKRPRAV